MKMDLPVTRGIWEKFIEATNSSKLSGKHQVITNAIKSAEGRLNQSESLEEFDMISKEIEGLKRQLKGVEIDIRTRPVQEKSVRNNEMKQLPEVYNQEFQPYYDKYIKLDNELKKQLKKFAKETEPIVKEMREIEQLEMSFHLLKMNVTGNDTKFLKLPIDSTHLVGSSFGDLRAHGISSGVAQFISKIKNKLLR
jgi:hypothetical protein